MDRVTVKGSVDNWIAHLSALFRRIETVAAGERWAATYGETDTVEEPLGLGASVTCRVPILDLTRPDPRSQGEQRITFEPRHRFTLGAAGRIDVFSYPRFGEAMLLRIPDGSGVEGLTWDEVEERVSQAPWKAFTQERVPLEVDLEDDHGLLQFLEDLVA